MKIIHVSLVVLLFSSLLAQESEAAGSDLRTSNRALLFSMDQISLNSFNGGFGIKQWPSSKTAYVAAIRISHRREDKEYLGPLDGSRNIETVVGASIGAEKHLKEKQKVSPFRSWYVNIGYEGSEKEITASDYPIYFGYPGYTNEIRTTLITVMVGAGFGLEYFLADNVSLTGQYNLGVSYKFGEEKIGSNIVTETDGRGVSELDIGIWSSSLILAIYF
jgi:hypothetical protein